MPHTPYPIPHTYPLPQELSVLQDHEAIKQLGHILKTNVRACTAVGHPFVIQLGRIYLDMLNVYKVLSENISSAVALNGTYIIMYVYVYVCAQSSPPLLCLASRRWPCAVFSPIPRFDVRKVCYIMSLEQASTCSVTCCSIAWEGLAVAS